MNRPSLRSSVFPASRSNWDIVIASVFLAATTASLVSAKTLAFTCVIFLTLFIATHAVRGTLATGLLKQTASTLPVTGFLLASFASLLWAPEPIEALPTLVFITFMSVVCLIAVRTLAADAPSKVARLAEGLWIGLLIGVLYLLLRHLTKGETDTVLLPVFAHKLVTIGFGEATRSTAPAMMLLGPALLAIAGGINKPWRAIFAGATIVVAAAAIVTSPHETSKLGLVIAAAVFILADVTDRWAYRLLQLGWVSACLLVVPLAMLAKSHDLQNASWLQKTAQQRILIWNEFARQTLDAPVLGHGIDMAAVLKPTIVGMAELPYVQTGKKIPANLKPFVAVHPHSVYLQVWFELGGIGVAMMLAAGLTLLARFAQLQPHQRPFMYATAAAGSVMLLSSYGLWQIWFVGMLAFTAIACAIAIKVSSAPPATVQESAGMLPARP